MPLALEVYSQLMALDACTNVWCSISCERWCDPPRSVNDPYDLYDLTDGAHALELLVIVRQILNT